MSALKDFFKKLSWICFFLVIGNYAGKWETTNCFKNLGYICKMAGGQNVKPTAAPGEATESHTVIWSEWTAVNVYFQNDTNIHVTSVLQRRVLISFPSHWKENWTTNRIHAFGHMARAVTYVLLALMYRIISKATVNSIAVYFQRVV